MELDARSRKTGMSLVLLTLLLPLTRQTGLGQNSPLYLGELVVEIKDLSDLYITAVASGNVGGSRCDHYATTHDYDSRSGTTNFFYLQHLDRSPGCPAPAPGSSYFAYGVYTITIQNNYLVMDYRDADYNDGSGHGTGYTSSDIHVYYNATNGVFYKDSNCDTAITSGYIAIWQDGRKDGSVPVKVPATITNNFGGGQVTVDGSNYSVPRYTKWNDGSGHSFAAITPQVYNYLNYGFTSWSDGSTSQTRSITAILDSFGVAYTANFSVTSPQRVTNFTAGGSIGSNPHLSWTRHPISDVNYYVAGYHQVSWDATNAASGIYLARLTATNELGQAKYSKVEKLLLAK